MDRALFILFLLALAACDAPRRGQTIRVAGCVEGRTAACVCSDGRMGTQVCLADDMFSACECLGAPVDAGDGGEDEDGSVRKDAESGDDSSFPPFDSGFDFDSGGLDSGFDFDSGFDSGVPGADSGPRDTGFDSGFDSGPRDVGFPDAGRDGGIFPPDPDGGIPNFDGGIGGICQILPELGLPCGVDADCNTIVPFGLLFCEQNICVEGCACDNGPLCSSPQVCDPISGRCL